MNQQEAEAMGLELEQKRFTREEAWGLYKDTEAKLADRKRKLHLKTLMVNDQKDFASLANHPAWKKLVEGAKDSLKRRPVAPQDQGYHNFLAYNDGRESMLQQMEMTVEGSAGKVDQHGTLEQWQADKKELSKEIDALEKLLKDSKKVYDKLVDEQGGS